jgi:hypothetical protein
MATINSGSIGGMYLQIDYTVTQNTSNNTSTVRATLKLVNHYALYMTTLSGSYLSVGGQKVDYSKTIGYGGSSTTTTTLYGPRDFVITHKSDGTASCNLTGTFVMNGTYREYSVGTMTVNQTITLPKIARSSSFTVSSSVNTGSAISGTVTPSSTAFNHKVLLKIGSTTKATIAMAVGATAFSYTIPHNWFPSSTSGIISAVLETYNGTTLVATTSKNITANVPSNIGPSISWFGIGQVANDLNGRYVQGKTSVTLSTSASAGDGASLSSYTYSGPGLNVVSASSNMAMGAFSSAGSFAYTVQVTDSRGRTANAAINFYVHPYSVPNIGPVSVQRCDANGNLSQSGTYAKYTVNSSYSNVENQNTRTVTVAYSSNNGASYSAETTIQAASDTSSTKTGVYGGGGFALASTYIIRFTIKDAYGATNTITAPLQSAARPINISSNGKGVAIGGMSTKDGFEVSMPSDFNGAVNIDGATTINGQLTTAQDIHSKGGILMGGLRGQAHELAVIFSNPTTSQYPHYAYIYGGNPGSESAIGCYDGQYNRGVWSYNDTKNELSIGNGNMNIYFGPNRLADIVVEVGASEGWTWRKWNDGRMELYGTVSHNPTALNDNINSVTVTMPVWFVNSAFRVLLTPAKCGLLVTNFGDCASNNDVTHTNNSFVLSYRYNNSQVYTVNFNVMVVGGWK